MLSDIVMTTFQTHGLWVIVKWLKKNQYQKQGQGTTLEEQAIHELWFYSVELSS